MYSTPKFDGCHHSIHQHEAPSTTAPGFDSISSGVGTHNNGDIAMDELCTMLKALADPLRLRILKLLPTQSEHQGVYNVSQLAEELGVSQPTVSHHLRILRQAGMVQCNKMKRDSFYWLDKARLEELSRSLAEDVACEQLTDK